MMPQRTLSAVIPVFNGQEYVADAIQSVLAQTYAAIECIVVDDGSTDGTPEVVRTFGRHVTYLRQGREGVSRARNRGAQHAKGELIGFLDHDDTWQPSKLARQIEALEEDQATMALCAMEFIDASGATLGVKRLRAQTDLLTGMLMLDGTETVSCSSTGLIRREHFLQIGGFDQEFSTSADWDLLVRILLTGTIAYVDEPLVRYRVHASNMSRNIARMERDMRRAFAKTFRDPQLPEGLRVQRRAAYARLYRMLAGSYRDSHQYVPAARTLTLATLHDPTVGLEAITRVGSSRA